MRLTRSVMVPGCFSSLPLFTFNGVMAHTTTDHPLLKLSQRCMMDENQSMIVSCFRAISCKARGKKGDKQSSSTQSSSIYFFERASRSWKVVHHELWKFFFSLFLPIELIHPLCPPGEAMRADRRVKPARLLVLDWRMVRRDDEGILSFWMLFLAHALFLLLLIVCPVFLLFHSHSANTMNKKNKIAFNAMTFAQLTGRVIIPFSTSSPLCSSFAYALSTPISLSICLFVCFALTSFAFAISSESY